MGGGFRRRKNMRVRVDKALAGLSNLICQHTKKKTIINDCLQGNLLLST